MIQRYKQLSIAWLIIGLILFLLLMVSLPALPIGHWGMIMAGFLGFAVGLSFLIAIGYFSKAKGQSFWWCLLGVFALGMLIVVEHESTDEHETDMGM